MHACRVCVWDLGSEKSLQDRCIYYFSVVTPSPPTWNSLGSVYSSAYKGLRENHGGKADQQAAGTVAEAGRGERAERTGGSMGYVFSKPASSDRLPPARPYLLNYHQRHHDCVQMAEPLGDIHHSNSHNRPSGLSDIHV